MNRPLVWTAVAFAAGLLIAAGTPAPGMLVGAGLVVLVLVLLSARYRWPGRDALLLVAVFVLIGTAYGAFRAPPVSDELSRFVWEHRDAQVRLEGTVAQVRVMLPEDDYTSFVLEVDQLTTKGRAYTVSGRTLIGWNRPTGRLAPGARVTVQGKLRAVLGPVNPRLRDFEDYLHQRGIHTRLTVLGEALRVVERAPMFAPRAWLAEMRQWQADALNRAVPAAVRDFVLTVWLGDRAHSDREQYPAFVRSGTAHILAVSGVHVGIVYLSLSYLLRGIVRNRKRRILILMAAILLFALMAGARVSSLRAATVLCLYLGANLLERDGDGPTALSLAALVFLILQPWLLFEPGFLLSFGSVSSLLLFSDPLHDKLSFLPRGLREGLSATLAVQIVPLPVAAHFFQVLPWFAPLANIVVLPLLSLTLWICFLTVLLAVVLPPLAVVVGHALVPPIMVIYAIAEFVSGIRAGHTLVSSPSMPAVVCYLCAAAGGLLALRVGRHRKKTLAFSLVCLLGCVLTWRAAPPLPGVYFLDVGHGDATLVYTPGGDTVLVDGGDRSDYRQDGDRIVVPFLLAHGLREIDYVVATHADRDHIGGLVSVVNTLDVGTLVLGPASSGKPLETTLLDAARGRGTAVWRAHKGETFDVAGATIAVLHPEEGYDPGTGTNDQSLVLHVSWPGISVLLPGDIEWDAEQRVAGTSCRAAVLKAPHHGSHTSSGEPLITAVSPGDTVISTRATNRRAGTGLGVLERYARHGVRVWRTDHHGGISLTAREGRATFTGERIVRGYVAAPGF